jgi:hypothetical protein
MAIQRTDAKRSGLRFPERFNRRVASIKAGFEMNVAENQPESREYPHWPRPQIYRIATEAVQAQP